MKKIILILATAFIFLTSCSDTVSEDEKRLEPYTIETLSSVDTVIHGDDGKEMLLVKTYGGNVYIDRQYTDVERLLLETKLPAQYCFQITVLPREHGKTSIDNVLVYQYPVFQTFSIQPLIYNPGH